MRWSSPRPQHNITILLSAHICQVLATPQYSHWLVVWAFFGGVLMNTILAGQISLFAIKSPRPEELLLGKAKEISINVVWPCYEGSYQPEMNLWIMLDLPPPPHCNDSYSKSTSTKHALCSVSRCLQQCTPWLWTQSNFLSGIIVRWQVTCTHNFTWQQQSLVMQHNMYWPVTCIPQWVWWDTNNQGDISLYITDKLQAEVWETFCTILPTGSLTSYCMHLCP